MSSISTVGGGQGLYEFLRGLTSKQQTTATQQAQTAGVQGTDAASGAEQADPTQGGKRAHGHHGHHGGGGFMKQIEAAVTSALQSAQSDPTTDPSSDPNKVIQDAIAKVLQGGSAPASSTSDASGPAQSAGASQSTPQDFRQLLESVGVDPQQFRADFMAALKQVKGGGLDPNASLQQTVPPGSTVDTLA